MMGIKEIIKELLNDGAEDHGQVCKVTSVEGMTCECEPINGNAPIIDVRLVADETEKAFILIPKVGSLVVVEFLNDTAGYVSMVSEISEVLCKIGTAWYSMNEDGFLIKKGNDSLKEILQLIIESQQQIMVLYGNNPNYVKLNQALLKLNNLLR